MKLLSIALLALVTASFCFCNNHKIQGYRRYEYKDEEEHLPIDELYEIYDSNQDDLLDHDELDALLDDVFDEAMVHDHEEDHDHDHKGIPTAIHRLKTLRREYDFEVGRHEAKSGDHDDEHGHDDELVPIPHADDLLSHYDLDNDTAISKDEFRDVAVELVWAVAPLEVHLPEHDDGHHDNSLTTGEKWAAGIVSCFIITLTSIIAIFFLPIGGESPTQKRLMGYLLSYAVGTLVGDAILHLIPHTFGYLQNKNAIHSHTFSDHDHDHSHGEENPKALEFVLGTMLMVLLGIFLFFFMEGILHIRSRRNVNVSPQGSEHQLSVRNVHVQAADSPVASDSPLEAGNHKVDVEKLHLHGGHIHHFGFINLSSDAFHNFTDGIAIGAAFSASWTVGISTSVAIFFHEISQEIGDFVILLKAGFTRKQAIMANFSCALTAFLGVFIGLGIGTTVEESLMWILPLVAGGFLYISMTNMLPIVNSQQHSYQALFGNCIAMFGGFGVMIGISYLEEAFE